MALDQLAADREQRLQRARVFVSRCNPCRVRVDPDYLLALVMFAEEEIEGLMHASFGLQYPEDEL